MKTIQSTIMRRVYMSYALSYTEQPLLWAGLVMGGAVALLGRFTHVASIVDNTLATPVGSVPTYIMNSFLTAIARGELGTVLVILTIASMSAVVVWQLSRIHIGVVLKAA
jgi:uncharacterized membrane protein